MTKRALGALIPYITVPFGLYVLHNGWVSLLLYHAGIVWWVMRGDSGVRFSALFSGWRAREEFVGIFFGSLGGLVLWALWPAIGLTPSFRTELSALGLSGASYTAFVLYHALVHPWLEELLWRGSLGSDVRHPTWTDVAFAGYHALVLWPLLAWPWVVVSVVSLTIAGRFWRMLALRCGGLLVPSLSHAAGSASVLTAVAILTRS